MVQGIMVQRETITLSMGSNRIDTHTYYIVLHSTQNLFTYLLIFLKLVKLKKWKFCLCLSLCFSNVLMDEKRSIVSATNILFWSHQSMEGKIYNPDASEFYHPVPCRHVNTIFWWFLFSHFVFIVCEKHWRARLLLRGVKREFYTASGR